MYFHENNILNSERTDLIPPLTTPISRPRRLDIHH